MPKKKANTNDKNTGLFGYRVYTVYTGKKGIGS